MQGIVQVTPENVSLQFRTGQDNLRFEAFDRKGTQASRFRARHRSKAIFLAYYRHEGGLQAESASKNGTYMHLLYAVSSSGNPLYEGKFGLRGRYHTYGQHSFIYDFIASCVRRGFTMTLLVEGLAEFPIAEPLGRYCKVIDSTELAHWPRCDLVLLDEPSEALMAFLPKDCRVATIIHRKNAAYSQHVITKSNKFICMTETALEYQRHFIRDEKLALIHQGVDLVRFHPLPGCVGHPEKRLRVLFYTRLDRNSSVAWRVITQLLRSDVSLTVLGDGEIFWQVSDHYGDKITLINYVPCHSIHNFLHSFDVVVSAGRGVMEALASGVPALCAGFEYGGPVVPENILAHLTVNITGHRMGTDINFLAQDIRLASALSGETCRTMAEEHCSIDRFVAQLIRCVD